MNKTYLIAIAAALMAAPMVLAHTDGGIMGTPKNYCEPRVEWNTHEYGPPATGHLLQGYEDGNILGNCDGGGLEVAVGSVINTNPSNPCPGDWWFSLDLDPVPPPVNGVCLDLPLADYDGHAEYARGGAWILVTTGGGVASADPNVGAGTLYCYGDEGHHAAFGSVDAEDLVSGRRINITVAADTIDLTGTGEGCGDFESDVSETFAVIHDCPCSVDFAPGLDGSYQVYVGPHAFEADGSAALDPGVATQGHIYWTSF